MNAESNQNDYDTVTLTLDNNETVECEIITILTVDDKKYIVLLPMEGAYSENGEVFLYGYEENGNDEPTLRYIDSEEEYEKVSDAFDEFLDSEEFDELVEDEENDDDLADDSESDE